MGGGTQRVVMMAVPIKDPYWDPHQGSILGPVPFPISIARAGGGFQGTLSAFGGDPEVGGGWVTPADPRLTPADPG